MSWQTIAGPADDGMDLVTEMAWRSAQRQGLTPIVVDLGVLAAVADILADGAERSVDG